MACRWPSAQSRCFLVIVSCVLAVALSEPVGNMATIAPSRIPASQDMTTFFPALKGDLTKVTWAHAVNSKDLLQTSLNDSSLMMLEADVVLGTTPESPNRVPVMGHPPANTSDLSLEEFLRTVVTHNTGNSSIKGVKLDFKGIKTFISSLAILKQTFEAIPDFPVWLNADILEGPVNATAVPVDDAEFLTKAKAEYPALMLSLGWTTRWGKGLDGQDVPQDQAKYSKDDIDAMLKTLDVHKVTQPITYAVRAAFAANSLDELKRLLDNTKQDSGKATLTVWSSDETDTIDVDKLRKTIQKIGLNRVYLDVGADLEKKLNLSSSSGHLYASLYTCVLSAFVILLGRLF